MPRFILLLILVAFGVPASPQVYTLPFDNLSQLRQNRAGIGAQPEVHSGIKPILMSDADVSGIPGLANDTADYYYKVTEKIFSAHLIELDKPDFKIYADFLFDFGFGREALDEISPDRNENSLFQNTRGFAVQGQIGKRVYFYTDFRENQGRYAQYMNVFVDSTLVFPGSGRIKPFGEAGYDYSMAGGFVGIETTDWLNLSFGHSKQFIGHGYRSLLLSDNAHNYPFASYEIDALDDKIQFRYTLALLQNLDRLPQGETPEAIFKRKVASWNYISFKPLPNVELGFFEEVLWKIFDDSLGSQPFDYRSLIPIPGLNSVILGTDDEENNARIGLNVAWFIVPRVKVYGQAVASGSQAGMDGFQAGALWSGIFERFDAKIEYNQAGIGVTGNPQNLQSEYHFNQPLGHILGRDFKEFVSSITYYHRRLLLQGQYNFQNSTSSSLRDERNILSVKAAYVFNPSTNLQVYTGYTQRQSAQSGDNDFWYFGIKTALGNRYLDF